MLTKYIEAAMNKAHYELMEDGEFFGTIPGFKGLWGTGSTLELCRGDLQSALEGWLLLKLWDQDDDIPVLGRLNLMPPRRERSRRAPAEPARAR